MNPEELRIGNLVYLENKLIINIQSIFCVGNKLDYIVESTTCNEYGIEDIYPIPITEELLLKVGFPKHKSTMDLLFDYTVCLERQHNELFVVNIQSGYIYKIDFMHQLQNLYFALKNNELEYVF